MVVSVPEAPNAVVASAVKPWLAIVSVSSPEIDCRALTSPSVVPPSFSRLTPLKSEPSMIVLICFLSETRSFEIAVRLSTSRPASDASRVFDFIWLTRSEICSAPATATSVTLLALLSELVTAFNLPRSPRSVWAVVYFAESSFVDATFRPVVIRLWVVSIERLVALRLWRAAMAPALVFTENAISSFPSRLQADSAA